MIDKELRYKLSITIDFKTLRGNNLYIYYFYKHNFEDCLKTYKFYATIYKIYEIEIFDNFEQRVLLSQLFNNYT